MFYSCVYVCMYVLFLALSKDFVIWIVTLHINGGRLDLINLYNYKLFCKHQPPRLILENNCNACLLIH